MDGWKMCSLLAADKKQANNTKELSLHMEQDFFLTSFMRKKFIKEKKERPYDRKVRSRASCSVDRMGFKKRPSRVQLQWRKCGWFSSRKKRRCGAL